MIFGLAKKANISNEQLHEFMFDWCSCVSLKSTKCTKDQANIIIESLQRIINNFSKPEVPEKIDSSDTLTTRQHIAILTIAKQINWNQKRIIGFAKHTLRLNELKQIEDLSPSQASQVITGLKKYSQPS